MQQSQKLLVRRDYCGHQNTISRPIFLKPLVSSVLCHAAVFGLSVEMIEYLNSIDHLLIIADEVRQKREQINKLWGYALYSGNHYMLW